MEHKNHDSWLRGDEISLLFFLIREMFLILCTIVFKNANLNFYIAVLFLKEI